MHMHRMDLELAQCSQQIKLKYVKVFGRWDHRENQRQRSEANGKSTKQHSKVKTRADAIQVKSTTTVHYSQTHTHIFTAHGSKVYRNKDEVYYVERSKRIELQNIPGMMSGSE